MTYDVELLINEWVYVGVKLFYSKGFSMDSYQSERFIEEVRTNNDIVDVVAEYVTLNRRGKYFFGICPFHSEKTGSFSVTPSKQMFYCFSCGKGGSVIQFIMYVENLNFMEAVALLAARAKLQVPEQDENFKKQQEQRQRVLKINVEAAKFFFNKLNEETGFKAARYLKERGLSMQTVRKFGIGYAPADGSLLYNYLVGNGFDPNDIIESGIATLTDAKKYVDRFKNRVIFPTFSPGGELVGFGGRALSSVLPKYLNSPQTIVHTKGKNLYAINFVKMAKLDKIIVVEGYMDAVSLHQCGICNVVASMGTALTEHQGRMLRRYAEEIIIAYDSDTAGQAATMKGLDLLSKMGCIVKVLSLPQGKDPDEFVKEYGSRQLKKLIDEAVGIVEYKIGILKREIDINTTEGAIKFLNKVAEILSKISNEVEREVYIKNLSKEHGIAQHALHAEVYKRLSTDKYKVRSKKSAGSTQVTQGDGTFTTKDQGVLGLSYDRKLEQYERILLILICDDNSIFPHISDIFNGQDFSCEMNKQVAELLFKNIADGKKFSLAELMSLMDEDSVNKFAKISYEDCHFEDNLKAAIDIVRKIRLLKLDKRQKEILNLLASRDRMLENDIKLLQSELAQIIAQKKNA